MMKKVRLKDIADRCGVTPTLVSAVLNQRHGTISCTPAKRLLIKSVADELGYRPNVLASAMVSHRIPVVVLMLNLSASSFHSHNRYFSSYASHLTLCLHERKLETLLVFYHTEEEQIERFQDLYGRSLIGGVVSNLIPQHHRDFVELLQSHDLPHVLWGRPEVPAVSIMSRCNYSFVGEYQRHVGTKRCYIMQEVHGDLVLYPYHDRPDYYRFGETSLPISESLLRDPDNLIVILGLEFYHSCPYPIAHPYLLEISGNEGLIPPGLAFRCLPDDSASISQLTAEIMASWMLHDQRPDVQTMLV